MFRRLCEVTLIYTNTDKPTNANVFKAILPNPKSTMYSRFFFKGLDNMISLAPQGNNLKHDFSFLNLDLPQYSPPLQL